MVGARRQGVRSGRFQLFLRQTAPHRQVSRACEAHLNNQPIICPRINLCCRPTAR